MSVVVRDLTKVFGQQRAVDNLRFEARAGEILGFLGPNGAGKSTTMKMITTYLQPSTGTAEVCGYDIIKDVMEVRRQIGYLPEHNPLYKDMYIREYLAFVARIHQISNPKQRIDELIHITGLEKEQHKLISDISKGYRQRVGLAQALLHDPNVIILDEPTSGLDMNQLLEIRRLIKHLGKTKTVIFSTHIMQEVQALCDRVIIINDGKLVADDSIDHLQDRLAGEDIIYLTLDQPQDLASLNDLPGVHRVQVMSKSEAKIYGDPSKDIRPDVFNHAVSQGWIIVEMKREQKNVEYIFQQLTQKSSAGV